MPDTSNEIASRIFYGANANSRLHLSAKLNFMMKVVSQFRNWKTKKKTEEVQSNNRQSERWK